MFSYKQRALPFVAGLVVWLRPVFLIADMKRFFTIALTVVAMLLVAVLTAMISLRLVIHGREVTVPNLAGLSDGDAAAAARRLGLNVSVETRFYSSAVEVNHVLSQAPAAGSRVRRGWQVRVTESLGGQHVAAPDLTGAGERPAMLMVRRLQLTLSPEAHLPAPGQPGIVIAQSPPPNTADAAGPSVSLLVTGPEPDASMFAYVMPRITGMRVAAAAQLLASAGLQLAPEIATPKAESTAAPDSAIAPLVGVPAAPPPESSRASDLMSQSSGLNPSAVILTQSPSPGQRVTRADWIHVGFEQAPSAAAADPVQRVRPDAR